MKMVREKILRTKFRKQHRFQKMTEVSCKNIKVVFLYVQKYSRGKESKKFLNKNEGLQEYAIRDCT